MITKLRKKVLPFFWNLGIFLVAIGVIRQSFADLMLQKGFGETFTGPLGNVQFYLVSFGVRIGLFPLDHFMTLDEKKLNLEFATAGFILMLVAGVIQTVLKWREH